MGRRLTDRTTPAWRKTRFPEHGFLLVLVVGFVLISWKVMQQVRLGVLWDTYSFLLNAAEFAGQGVGYDEPHRPPVLPLLTSLGFRVLTLDIWIIQVVDGILVLSGLPALYLVLRRRVSQLAATICSLGILAVSPVWYWIGIGYSDLGAVSITTWALYFTIKATEDDPRWYVAIPPTLLLASLTRVTALFAVFALFALILYRGRPIAHARHLLLGLAAAIVVYLPFAVYYSSRLGDALYPYLFYLQAASAQHEQSSSGLGIEPGGWTPLAVLLLALLFCFALWGIARAVASQIAAHPALARAIPLALTGGALVLAGQLFGGLVTRQIALAAGVLLIWKALAPRDSADLQTGRISAGPALDVAMLLLLLSFVDSHAHQPVIVWRYVVTFSPAMMYFLALGWSNLARDASRMFTEASGDKRLRTWDTPRLAATTTWGALLLLLAGSIAANSYESTREEIAPLVYEAKEAAEWILQHGQDPRTLTVYSDVWPLTSWYLGSEALAMRSFDDRRGVAHELEKREADYYVTLGLDEASPTMTPMFDRNGLVVLARTSASTHSNPSIRYLGKAWDNYLEELVDFSFGLYYDGGFEAREGSVNLDYYSVEELHEFDAVAVYGARWSSWARAERVLREYVETGGTLVIDASRNLSTPGYSMLDTVVFDTVIRRDLITPAAVIHTLPELADSRAAVPARIESVWRDENGEPWLGAFYDPLPESGAVHETLATIDGHPLVSVQALGSGRIYWIGGNLFWHAHLSDDPHERALVRAILDHATRSSSETLTRLGAREGSTR